MWPRWKHGPKAEINELMEKPRISTKTKWPQTFPMRLVHWIVKKIWRSRTWLVVLVLLIMTFIVVMTQVCDQTSCSYGDYHVIVLSYNFIPKRYLANVEEMMRMLFPQDSKPRSYGDVQMTFLKSVNIFNKTRYSSESRWTFLRANKTTEKKEVSKAVRYKQFRKSRKNSSSNLTMGMEDQVRKPSLAETPHPKRKEEPMQPLLTKEICYEIGVKAQLGKVRDLLSREGGTKGTQFRKQKRTQNLTKEKENRTSPEHPTMRDFRLRAQRIAKYCPAMIRNKTREGTPFSKAWHVSMSKAETVKSVFWHQQSSTSYCFVPKAECTFWIRVFSFLQNFTGIAAKSPWDIPRLAVHTQQQNPYAHGAPLWYFEKEVMAPESLRFIVTRDPFARLWSAYVDKLLLPDFWGNIGVHVVRRFRKFPTRLARKCGHDVTFSEFIQFALTSSNSHWEPIYKRCDPCRFQPQIIADISSFARDSSLVLRRLGMENILHNLNRTEQKERELQTLIQYNFDVTNITKHKKGCVTPFGVARLLWKAFQINGYLPVQHLYPMESEKSFSIRAFTDRVITVFRDSTRLEKQLKAQRKYFRDEAYRSLSPELLERLRETYRLDFKLFGYDASPFTVQ